MVSHNDGLRGEVGRRLGGGGGNGVSIGAIPADKEWHSGVCERWRSLKGKCKGAPEPRVVFIASFLVFSLRLRLRFVCCSGTCVYGCGCACLFASLWQRCESNRESKLGRLIYDKRIKSLSQLYRFVVVEEDVLVCVYVG